MKVYARFDGGSRSGDTAARPPRASAARAGEPARMDAAPLTEGISTRAFLAILTIGLSLPLLAFSSYLIWRQAQAERGRIEAELRQTAGQISVVLDREFNILVTLLEAVAASPAMKQDDFARVHEQASTIQAMPGVNITLRDTTGKMLMNARSGFGAPESFFSVVRDHDAEVIRDKRPVMSNVADGVTRGGPSAAAAIPILRNGEVAYILQANLPTGHFSALLREFRLSGDASAFIVDRNNVYVANYGGRNETAGSRHPFTASSPDSSGMSRGADGDGRAMVGAMIESAQTLWRVGVMAPEASVTAPVNRALRDLAMLGLASSGLGLLFAFATGRRISSSIRALASAGEGLRRNEMAEFAPTPLREVNEVARSLGAASRQLRESREKLRESEDWLQESLRAGRAFVFTIDIAADTISPSGSGAAMLGLEGAAGGPISGAHIRSRINPDDLARALEDLKKISPAAPGYEPKFRFARPDGETLWLALRGAAAFGADGKPARITGLAVDITDGVRAEEAQARLSAVVETSRDMIISVAPGGTILTWNAGAARMFGYTAAETVGKSLKMLVPDELDDHARIVDTMARLGSIQLETVRVAKDGRRIDVLISASTVRMSDGTRGTSAIYTDISGRRRSEARQRTLINELNHRVKNTLATIQSIAAHTFRGEAHAQAVRTFTARMIGLSEAHNILTVSSWEDAGLADIAERVIAPHQMEGAARFRCAGPPVRLAPRGALALALALHELCTNAAKYGALSNAEGLVDIVWRIEAGAGGRRLAFCWTESGGPPVEPPTRPGFGTRLVRGVLSDDLGAQVTLKYEAAGFICEFDAPLPEKPV